MAEKKQPLTPEKKLARALVPQDQQPYKLPKGWVWTYLLDGFAKCCDSSRKPVSASERATLKGDIPYYGATGQVGWINDYLTNEELVLIGEDGAPFLDVLKDKAYIINGKAWINNHAHILKSYFGHIGNLYLVHYLNSFDYRGFVNGTTRLKLTQGNMKKVPIPLPPLQEQQRIVARIESLFAKLDAARDKLQQVLDTQEARRAAILHEAFTGRLTGHKGSAECRGKREEEGLQNPEGTEFVPEGWKNIDLKDCIQLLSGQDFPRNKYNDENEGIPYITGASNFLSNHVIINRWTSTPTVIAKENDILLVCKGSGYGKVCIADFQEAHIARQIMALRPKDFINNRFLYYYLQNMYKTLRNQGQGLIPGISRKVVLNLNITLPPLDEQQKIVQFLDRFDRQNDKVNTLIQQSLSQIDLLKKSILARAFRGQLGTQDPSDPDARDLLTGD